MLIPKKIACWQAAGGWPVAGCWLALAQAMPRGPAPSLLQEVGTLPSPAQPLLQGVTVLADDGTASSSSLTSWESDSESELGLQVFDALLEDEDTTTSETEACLGGDRKRRRLAVAKNGCRSACPAMSEVTLIILDWDDTLLPSTWLLEQGLGIMPSALPNEEQKVELNRVALCVIKTLRRAKRLGHVTVVTNGQEGWVELSCGKFLPSVAPLLEGIKVSSARSAYEHSHGPCPVQWKRMAFQREIGAFFQMTSSLLPNTGRQRNIVSIGDAMSERTALMEATQGKECRAKSLKLVERPSPEQLVQEHELLSNCLRPLVEHEGSLDLCLDVPRSEEQLVHQ